MRCHQAPPSDLKGWLAGPWESALPIAIGYASEGIDEPHFHERLTEVYLVARGRSQLRIGEQTVELQAGSVVIVEPGEPHTFLSSSDDYFHFVIHLPSPAAGADKVRVDRSVLGL